MTHSFPTRRSSELEWFPAKNRSTCCSLQLNTSVIKPGLPAKGVWYPLEPFLIMYVSTICCQSFFLEPMITTLREEKIMDCSLHIAINTILFSWRITMQGKSEMFAFCGNL